MTALEDVSIARSKNIDEHKTVDAGASGAAARSSGKAHPQALRLLAAQSIPQDSQSSRS